MSSHSRYTFKLSALLTDKNLLALSYNQILDNPANLAFDIDLCCNLSIYTKFLLLNKIKTSIKYNIYFINKPIRKDLVLKSINRTSFRKQFFFENLILEQIIANVLIKLLKIQNKKIVVCSHFFITYTKNGACQKLNETLKKVNFAFYCNDLKVYNKITLMYFLRIIKEIIIDQKFIDCLTSFVLNTQYIDKSSSFHQTFCNVYLTKFDLFILKFFNKQSETDLFNFKEKPVKPEKQLEQLIAKALLMTKKSSILTSKKICSKKSTQIKPRPILCYIRYLNHFFIGVSFLNLSLSFVPSKISFFLKSVLHLNVKFTKWADLNMKSINFCGVKTKKEFLNLYTKRFILIKIFSPLREIKEELLKFGIFSRNQKPKAILYLINLFTKSIIIWYNTFIFGLLYYYKKTSNYKKLSYNLYYFLKWSLLYTLKKKHKKSLEKIVIKYWRHKNKIVTPFLLLLSNFSIFTSFEAHKKVFTNLLYIYRYQL